MAELFESLKKYNYWDGQAPKAGILRTPYLARLQEYIGNPLIKVLIGQRRAGKSYLLRQVIRSLLEQGIKGQNIFYLNKELLEFDSIRSYDDLWSLIKLYREQLHITDKAYVLLDEVQEINGWERAVNSLAQNHKEPYEVFISGSNSTLLSGELATLLTGRYIAFEIFPFSYSEYCTAYHLPHGKDSYLSYLRMGGLPELLNLSGEESRRQYVAAVRDSILLKDIVGRFNIKDAILLQDIFSFCADNIGNLMSVANIVKYLKGQRRKTNHETVSAYVSYLCNAFLLHEAPRYDVRGKIIFTRQRKYYLNDMAFRSFLSSGFDPAPGKLLENSIYLYYRSRGYRVSVGTLSKQEVDFVVEKNNERIYVQTTYLLSDEKVIEREFGVLEKIADPYPKLVISLDDASFGMRNGIQHLQPWEMAS